MKYIVTSLKYDVIGNNRSTKQNTRIPCTVNSYIENKLLHANYFLTKAVQRGRGGVVQPPQIHLLTNNFEH